MSYSPPPARGHLYSTSRTLRCLAYESCVACQRCKHYDPTAWSCVFCESRKPAGPGHHCECGQHRRDIVSQFEARFDRSLIPKAGEVQAPLDAQVALDPVNEALIQAMRPGEVAW